MCRMQSILLLFASLLVGAAFAATHVNISIAQHASPLSTSPADVTYIDGKAAPAELRAGPADMNAKVQSRSDFSYRDNDHHHHHNNHRNNQHYYVDQMRSAKLQLPSGQQQQQAQVQVQAQSSSARSGERATSMRSRQHNQRQQFRQSSSSEQEKRNQEFERYIQNYHSGPTVETVYESASPTPQRYQQSSSSTSSSSSSSSLSSTAPMSERFVAIGARPAHYTHTFERLVELAAAAPSDAERNANLQQQSAASTDASSSHGGVSVAAAVAPPSISTATSSSSLSSSSSGGAAAAAPPAPVSVTISTSQGSSHNNNNNNHIHYDDLSQGGASAVSTSTGGAIGYDQSPPSAHYDPMANGYNNVKPIFEPAPNYNYNPYNSYNSYNHYNNNNNQQQQQHHHQQQQPDVQGQYPPSVLDDGQAEEDYGYYGGGEQSGYYGGGGGGGGYLSHGPTVTKTIQIAQPALKAKKYEVRHPAIQKEFYDIEERVVIKPAGTIVVELERPVAKIPKGETILPLLHPAYNAGSYQPQQVHGQSVIQTQSSSAGSYGPSVRPTQTAATEHNNGDYGPSSGYMPHQSAASSSSSSSSAGGQAHHSSLGSSTIASTLIASPTTFDQPSAKDDFVEANLQRKYSDESPQYSVSATDSAQSEEKHHQPASAVMSSSGSGSSSSGSGGDGDYFVAIDSSGNNQRRLPPSKHLTPKMMMSKPEQDFRYTPLVDVSNNGAPQTQTQTPTQTPTQMPAPAYSYNGYVPSAPYIPQAPKYPSNFYNNNYKQSPAAAAAGYGNNNNNNNNQYKAEYYTGEYYNSNSNNDNNNNNNNMNNAQQSPEFKPARLQLAAVRQAAAARPAHIIRHEHNIHLPPMQHNIYLGRLEAGGEMQPRKQQLQQQQRLSSARYTNQDESSPQHEGRPARVMELKQQQQQQHRGAVALYAPAAARPTVHYSAPYAHMRYTPEQQQLHLRQQQRDYAQRHSARLILEKESGAEAAPAKDGESQKTPAMMPTAHIHIQLPNDDEPHAPIMVSSTLSPPVRHADRDMSAEDEDSAESDEERQPAAAAHSHHHSDGYEEAKPDCQQQQQHQPMAAASAARGDQKFQRIVETQSQQGDASAVNEKSTAAGTAPGTPAAANIHSDSVDVNVKSTAGHVATPGSRVIAATPAPTDASASSESFHKRRIVVNHPFQTVREVVEHEPITNYHQIQVSEPATPSLHYEQALQHYQTHGAIRKVGVPAVYHHYQPSASTSSGSLSSSSSTHDNLRTISLPAVSYRV